MVNKLFLIIIGSLSLVMYSCSKEYSATRPDSMILDPEAKKFIDAAQIEDTVEISAINTLVIQLKDSMLWTRFFALYPMVGGTASSTKWNLVDPRDEDEAFRLTFHGLPLFAQTGVLFPNTSTYADTHLYDSLLLFNDNSIGYYSRTQNTVSGYDMGCIDYVAPFNQMTIYHASNATAYFGLSIWGYQPSNTTGLFMISATPDNVEWYERGKWIDQLGSPPQEAYTGYSILIGWCLEAEAVGKRECAFAAIGEGLSGNEIRAFNNIVVNFQSALNR